MEEGPLQVAHAEEMDLPRSLQDMVVLLLGDRAAGPRWGDDGTCGGAVAGRRMLAEDHRDCGEAGMVGRAADVHSVMCWRGVVREDYHCGVESALVLLWRAE